MAPEKATEQLIDGFESLVSEYKDLTVRYRELERTLQAALRECKALRALIPERLRGFDFTNHLRTEQSPAQPEGSVIDCLESLYPGQSANIQETINNIRAADEACVHLREQRLSQLPGDKSSYKNMEVLSVRSGPISNFKNRHVQINLPERSSKSSTPAHQDAPRCPFAAMGGSMPIDHPSLANQEVPTPRSSQDVLRSKRQSFHDPLRPTMSDIQPISPARSVTSGPACPIRYLGEHSPEEIAKYFEDHKHELPRSHEICIKRFQDNAQSIRELDAKYGSLVTMINGLGQKHQPMLPTEPKSQDEDPQDDESNQKIQEWANQITDSEVPARPEERPEPGVDSTQAVISHEQEPERQQRFDRPLKDIRVGESPSRPWGVPIPAKFMHRTPSSGSNVSDAAREAAPNMTDNVKDAGEDVDSQKQAKRRGVYRVNTTHGKASESQSMMSKMMQHNKPEAFKRTKPGMWNSPPDHKKADESSKQRDGVFIARNGDGADDAAGMLDDKTIVNRGLAIVSDAKHFQSHSFINQGTLVLGDFTLQELKELMPQLMVQAVEDT